MVMIANAFITSGQETNFTGKVKDEQGKALSGASLSFKGSKVKTLTNTMVNFQLKQLLETYLWLVLVAFQINPIP